MKAEDDRLGCSCGWRRDVCNKSGVIFVFFYFRHTQIFIYGLFLLCSWSKHLEAIRKPITGEGGISTCKCIAQQVTLVDEWVGVLVIF